MIRIVRFEGGSGLINNNSCFMDKELALRYFATLTSVLATFFNIQEELSTRLKLCQGVPKVVSEVQDNDEVLTTGSTDTTFR